jgi:hypothetical protein
VPLFDYGNCGLNLTNANVWLRNSKFIYYVKQQDAERFGLFRYDMIEKVESEVDGFSMDFDTKLGTPLGALFVHLELEPPKTKPKPLNEEDFLRQQMVILLYSSQSDEDTTNLRFQFYKFFYDEKAVTQKDTNIISVQRNELCTLRFFYHLKPDDQDDVLIMFESSMGKTTQQTWELYEYKDEERMRVYNLEDDYGDLKLV